MNKIIFPFLASLLVCLFSSCIQTSPSSKANPGRDKTVMLHWLDLDDQGIVRLTGNDGNLSKSSNPFTGEAIETFEQSPTKSVSEWKEGKKHGTTTEYFYNGRKRRIIIEAFFTAHHRVMSFKIESSRPRGREFRKTPTVKCSAPRKSREFKRRKKDEGKTDLADQRIHHR